MTLQPSSGIVGILHIIIFLTHIFSHLKLYPSLWYHITMIYVEVFAFASFLVPLAVAFTPVCVPSSQGITIETIGLLTKTFCAGLEKKNFTSDLQVYGVPNVSLGFIPANGTNPCDLNNCLSSYDSLVESCKWKHSSSRPSNEADQSNRPI